MYAGHIVETGAVDDIFYNPMHPYTAGLLRSIPRLDADEKERLIPIDGTPVDMLNPPPGCPFAPRCGNCMKICLRAYPPAAAYGDDHFASCWLNERDGFNSRKEKSGG
jgi:oligopeptide transport system ATP-binding protein